MKEEERKNTRVVLMKSWNTAEKKYADVVTPENKNKKRYRIKKIPLSSVNRNE